MGKYDYCRLTMAISTEQQILQEKVLWIIRSYLYDILVIYKEGWKYHKNKIYQALQRLADNGPKVNFQVLIWNRRNWVFGKLGF